MKEINKAMLSRIPSYQDSRTSRRSLWANRKFVRTTDSIAMRVLYLASFLACCVVIGSATIWSWQTNMPTSFIPKLPPGPCSGADIPNPDLFGAKIISLSTTDVQNYQSPLDPTAHISFCNVSIVYTHPGQGDRINAHVWLPSQSDWNGRFQGVGGGGYVTGLNPRSMGAAVARGYSAASTDGGHSPADASAAWALLSPGNVNMYLLQDFASVSLNDMTVLGKAVTKSYYGTKPKYSYWNGCSTGGRQGFMMAQRYPTAYDGIYAGAPAINWARFVPATSWAAFVLARLVNQGSKMPELCEIEALTKAATEACDGLDGLVDGIVGAPGLCKFDARQLVGQKIDCPGEGNVKTTTISDTAAKVAQAAWSGARSAKGEWQWYGWSFDGPLMGSTPRAPSPTPTASANPLAPQPTRPPHEWFRIFLAKDTGFNISTLTHADWDHLVHASYQQYASIIDTSDSDLSEFRAAGGRLLTWHGMADPVIPFNGTVHYYNRVLKRDPSVRDYFRFFMAPGVSHCGGGLGASPDDPLGALVKWVESGEPPKTLNASVKRDGSVWRRELCEYPALMKYVGGDIASAQSFKCA